MLWTKPLIKDNLKNKIIITVLITFIMDGAMQFIDFMAPLTHEH